MRRRIIRLRRLEPTIGESIVEKEGRSLVGVWQQPRTGAKVTALDVAIIRRWALTPEAIEMGTALARAEWLARTSFRQLSVKALLAILLGDSWAGIGPEWRPEALR